MNRREFLSATALTAVTGSVSTSAAEARSEREFYELRRYVFGAAEGDSAEIAAEQRKRFDAFMRDAAVPALNRMGLKPIGVFHPKSGDYAYLLIPHRSLDSVATLTERLAADLDFTRAGADYIDASREHPAYRRIESSLLQAFSGMAKLEVPASKGANRVVQLRIYESPSEKTNLKKIEMFNDAGEIKIFRSVGLHPVFFGRAFAGEKLPNLTYMLAFESEEELNANWGKFRTDPAWLKLKAMPEYADKTILSGITNLILKPAEYSQI